MLFIAEMIPILIFYFIFADPDRFLLFSITSLGRLVAILVILFYTCIHMSYGFMVCIFVIFYYQTDMVESISTVKPMSAAWTGSYETGLFKQNTALEMSSSDLLIISSPSAFDFGKLMRFGLKEFGGRFSDVDLDLPITTPEPFFMTRCS